MKKIAILGLVLFSLGCRGYSNIPKAKASASATANCQNAAADRVTNAKSEQDPNVTDDTACATRVNYSKKYNGLTCTFPDELVGRQTIQGETTKIQPITCDSVSLHAQRAPYLTKPGTVELEELPKP